MEFRKSRLCVALMLLLCACYHVSSQPTDPASQPTDDANKMQDMIFRHLQDTGSIITDIKTLIMLQMQHSRDVTKANNDLQSQYNSAMAGMTETLAAMNSQISSLAQQQHETRAAMNSQISSLANQQKKTLNNLDAMNYQISSLTHQIPKAASEACAGPITGPTTMLIDFDFQPMTAPCDGQGWVVIQRRVDGVQNFKKSWEDYRRGFGDLAGSFWLGLQSMHRLTTARQAMLRVELEDWEGNSAWAQYASFRLEGRNGNYKLHLGAYSGTAGDSLGYNDGMMFSTEEMDNDRYIGNCAAIKGGGGWWYGDCSYASLNGEYVPGGASSHAQGIYWYGWKGSSYSYKKAQMKVFFKAGYH